MYDKNVFMQLYFSIFCKWSGAIFVRMYDKVILKYVNMSIHRINSIFDKLQLTCGSLIADFTVVKEEGDELDLNAAKDKLKEEVD